MAEKSGNYASFFVQKRLIFNFTPIHQVLSELFKKTILPYETERQGPDHQCGPIKMRGPIDLCGPKVPLHLVAS